jgi:hypothetical protein
MNDFLNCRFYFELCEMKKRLSRLREIGVYWRNSAGLTEEFSWGNEDSHEETVNYFALLPATNLTVGLKVHTAVNMKSIFFRNVVLFLWNTPCYK